MSNLFRRIPAYLRPTIHTYATMAFTFSLLQSNATLTSVALCNPKPITPSYASCNLSALNYVARGPINQQLPRGYDLGLRGETVESPS